MQRELLGRFAQSNSLEVVATYEDVGESGVTLSKRAGLSRLLSDVVSGQVDFASILVLDVSRWGRFLDLDEAAHYEFVCRSHGIAVTYCLDRFSDAPSSHLAKQVKRIMAADYVRQISTRTRNGKQRAALVGRAPGSWPRFLAARQVIEANGLLGPILRCGEFRTHPAQALRLVPAGPERSLIVRRIFQMFTGGGLRLTEIARILASEGSVWTDGSPWTGRRVGRVLRDPLAIGLQRHGRSRTVLGVREEEQDPSRWGEVQVFAPLVPPDTFRMAQERLQQLGGRSRHTDKEMIEGLRRLLRREGRLSASVVNACPEIPCARLYEVRFGTLGVAFQLAGYKRPAVARGGDEYGAPISRDAVLGGLLRLAGEKGAINVALVQADPRLPSIGLIRKSFGSLTAAYRAAGLR